MLAGFAFTLVFLPEKAKFRYHQDHHRHDQPIIFPLMFSTLSFAVLANPHGKNAYPLEINV